MEIEKERKYLVNLQDLHYLLDGIKETKFDSVEEITQMYLADRSDHSLRVRIINNQIDYEKAYICYKYYLTDDSKEEYEYPFFLDKAKEIEEKKDYQTILKKTRYKLDGWDIDHYPFGLVVAEFEFSEDNPIPDPLPDWIREDVTGVHKYSNVYIGEHWDELNETK
jgi:CYTH domain-containing protein